MSARGGRGEGRGEVGGGRNVRILNGVVTQIEEKKRPPEVKSVA